MHDGAVWVDEVCRDLQVPGVSPWLTWARREKHPGLSERLDADSVPGVYVLACGAAADALEAVFVGEADDLRLRLRQLEGAVKWRQHPGFDALRDVLERVGDQQTMTQVWVKVIAVVEQPLFPTMLLTDRRLNALGARRRQLQAVLLAEHVRRYGGPLLADRPSAGMYFGAYAASDGRGDGRGDGRDDRRDDGRGSARRVAA